MKRGGRPTLSLGVILLVSGFMLEGFALRFDNPLILTGFVFVLAGLAFMRSNEDEPHD